MLITVLILGGTMLGASVIVGFVTNLRLRQASDVVSSAQAIYAADAGLERGAYLCFRRVPANCNNFTLTLGSGARATVSFIRAGGGPVTEIRSTGTANRSTRSLRMTL